MLSRIYLNNINSDWKDDVSFLFAYNVHLQHTVDECHPVSCPLHNTSLIWNREVSVYIMCIYSMVSMNVTQFPVHSTNPVLSETERFLFTYNVYLHQMFSVFILEFVSEAWGGKSCWTNLQISNLDSHFFTLGPNRSNTLSNAHLLQYMDLHVYTAYKLYTEN